MRIGIIGFSAQSFNQEKAKNILESVLRPYASLGSDLSIVSGLTNIGVPALAYQWAVNNCVRTVGYSCEKSKDYDCFDCDEVHLIGENWGDESEEFLQNIDLLVRLGGGSNTFRELKRAKELNLEILEFDIDSETQITSNFLEILHFMESQYKDKGADTKIYHKGQLYSIRLLHKGPVGPLLFFSQEDIDSYLSLNS